MTAETDLQSVVKSAICHVTSPEGWCGILAARAILPNDGRFASSYPQSVKSYATMKPAVALFDFEKATPEQMIDHWWKCQTFFRRYVPATYVLVLDRARLPIPLITYDEAMAEFGCGAVMIPYLEVWSVQPVPIEAVTEVVVVSANGCRTLAPSDPRLVDAASLASGSALA